MGEKRAVKKTKNKPHLHINYRREIWDKIAQEQLKEKPKLTKDHICKSIKGYRSGVYRDLTDLINEGVLEYNNQKLSISKTNDLELIRASLVDQLAIFKETRKNTLDQIRKRIESSPTKGFFEKHRLKIMKTLQDTIGKKPEWRYDDLWEINPQAKDWILMLPTLIDNLVRGSFSLYTAYMLKPVSSKTWKIFEKDIKTAVNEINKTRKMLLELALEFSKDKKEAGKFFDRWWSEITYGLTLEHKPFQATATYGKMDNSKEKPW